MGSRDKFKKKLRKQLWLDQGTKCHYCLRPTSIEMWSLDHIVPRCIGGPLRRDNLIGSCFRCNRKKSNKTYEAFIFSPYVQRLRMESLYRMALAA